VSCSRIIRSPPPAVGLTRCSQAQRPPRLPRPCRARTAAAMSSAAAAAASRSDSK
jgi:hypothetical protein